MTEYKRKLIEVALPLESINRACAHEKSVPRRGHPATVHLWWARRPLAACRAVLFASLVDDPSEHTDQFPTESDQERERRRLFAILEELVQWGNSTNERVLNLARAEIIRSCGGEPPPIFDPFCGGGSIPLEAQRLGLETHASDLNPVAVLITKALCEIPPRFAGLAPVHPESQSSSLGVWTGAKGLAEDIRWYGNWIVENAEKRLGKFYPSVSLPTKLGGGRATVIAWLWARTVRCPNPACGHETPLLTNFVLSSRRGREAYLIPKLENDQISFDIGASFPTQLGDPTTGYKRGMSGIFSCAFCGNVTTRDYVASQGIARRLGVIPTAIVVEGSKSRVYLPASIATTKELPKPDLTGLDVQLELNPRDLWCRNFGLTTFADLFTQRQLVTLTTLSDLIREVHGQVSDAAVISGLSADGAGINEGGAGARAYADAIATYLSFALDKLADWSSSLCSWIPSIEGVRDTFARQAIPMVWDFAEINPLSKSVGNFSNHTEWVAQGVSNAPCGVATSVVQADSTKSPNLKTVALVATDPPYYNNISYSDLSDFFYVWLRRSLRSIYPDICATVLTPKVSELVATTYRFEGNRTKADEHFESGLSASFARIREVHSTEYPLTVYYAFKQAEANVGDSATASTGWEKMLGGLINAGFAIVGTWPVRSERVGRMISVETNALASSVVLVCRPRSAEAALATRKEFLAALKSELPGALRRLQQGNIAPVDLAQAAIGPGMSVFSRYAKVIEADGSAMSVRTALGIINQVLDETLAQQEGDFDADTRWAVAWFEQFAMGTGDYGAAETLSKAKNSAVNALVEAGFVEARAGKVRLLERQELAADWDPEKDRRLTVWDVTQHLIRALEVGGESAAATLVVRVGGLAETARELAYRLYNICERKRWSKEAQSYNSLVVAWPEILRIAADQPGQTIQLSFGG